MKAVMLIHGFLTDDNDFGKLYDVLGNYYDIVERCILPGHGEGNDLKTFTVDGTLTHVLEVFDRLAEKASEIDLIGFSLGGALSTYVAQNRRIRNLILLAPANKFLNWHVMFQSMAFYVKTTNKAIQESDKPFYDTSEDIGNALKNYIDNEKLSFSITQKRLIPNYNYHTLSTFGKLVKRCNENLTQIDCPTLIVWGKLDQLVPMESCMFLYNMCRSPYSHFDIMLDLSHLMLRSTNSEWLIKKITAFIEQNDTKTE